MDGKNCWITLLSTRIDLHPRALTSEPDALSLQLGGENFGGDRRIIDLQTSSTVSRDDFQTALSKHSSKTIVEIKGSRIGWSCVTLLLVPRLDVVISELVNLTRSSMQHIATAVFVRNGEYCKADKQYQGITFSMESHVNRNSPITYLRRCQDRQRPLSLKIQISLMRSQYDSILHHRLLSIFPALIAHPYTDRHLLTLSLTTEIHLRLGLREAPIRAFRCSTRSKKFSLRLSQLFMKDCTHLGRLCHSCDYGSPSPFSIWLCQVCFGRRGVEDPESCKAYDLHELELWGSLSIRA